MEAGTNSKSLTFKVFPKVAIIILNWNGWKDTIECLESVLRNDYPNYQIIVVDNNSPNNSMEYLKAWAEGFLIISACFRKNTFCIWKISTFLFCIAKKGFKLYVNLNSKIYHKISSTVSGNQEASPMAIYYFTRNRLYFMLRREKNGSENVFF